MSEINVDAQVEEEEFTGSYTTETETPRTGQGVSATAPGQGLSLIHI